MTTIAWCSRYVAADSQVNYGSCRGAGPVQKLKRVGDNVYACIGTGALFDVMVEWIEKGAIPADVPTGTAENSATVIKFADGKAHMYKSDLPYPHEMIAPDAWGTGAEFAIGAMEAGADAPKAVACAIKRDVHSGGPMVFIDLQPLAKDLAA